MENNLLVVIHSAHGKLFAVQREEINCQPQTTVNFLLKHCLITYSAGPPIYGRMLGPPDGSTTGSASPCYLGRCNCYTLPRYLVHILPYSGLAPVTSFKLF